MKNKTSNIKVRITDIQFGSVCALLLFICLFARSNCPAATTTNKSDLQIPSVHTHDVMIGHNITMSGKFALNGKLGPYILCDEVVFYLLPKNGSSFGWGPEYAKMDGKNVRISGTLHFVQYSDFGGGNKFADKPYDHFYFEAETAKVALE